MLAYIFRRMLLACLTLALVSFLVYGLVRAMPGDPLIALIGMNPETQNIPEAELEAARHAWGLDRPWFVAYLEWGARIVSGDLGFSIKWKVPVFEKITEALGPTLLLSGPSLLLAYLLSVPLGLWSAHRSGKLDERALSTILYILYSVPSYVAGSFLLVLLGLKLDLLPLGGLHSDDADQLPLLARAWDLFKHMALPVLCSTYGALAYTTRFVRSNLMEALGQDYIRTARAKGLGEGAVLVRHAFRNSLIPFVTHVGLALPALFSGSVLLEQIFNWPGIGRLFFQAFDARDYPVILGLTLMFSVLIVTGTLLADLLCAALDPRVSYS